LCVMMLRSEPLPRAPEVFEEKRERLDAWSRAENVYPGGECASLSGLAHRTSLNVSA
jgi:hypothetical protein